MKKMNFLIVTFLIATIFTQVSFAEDNTPIINPICQTPGQADSFKLALSWQPAFCESHRSKPECKISDSTVFQASHFTLHGLWPNKNECGINYGMCGEYKTAFDSFCDYAPVDLDNEVSKTLTVLMPSFAEGTCLERHEWYKHGTCQTRWSPSEYFSLAAKLVNEFNNKNLSNFIKENIGKTVQTKVFFDFIDETFGPGSNQRFSIDCDKKGNLVDVFINLPKELSEKYSLLELIHLASPSFSNHCGSSFRIDPIGFF